VKKSFLLIICLLQLDDSNAMRRNANNNNNNATNSETMVIEDDSIESRKLFLRNLRKRKLSLFLDSFENFQNNNNNNSNEEDFSTIIHRPNKENMEIEKRNSAFSRLIEEEYKRLKNSNKIIMNDPRFRFFLSDSIYDDFSEDVMRSTFYAPGQIPVIDPSIKAIIDEIYACKPDESDEEDDDYNFPELRELEYKLKKLEFDSVNETIDEDLTKKAGFDEEGPITSIEASLRSFFENRQVCAPVPYVQEVDMDAELQRPDIQKIKEILRRGGSCFKDSSKMDESKMHPSANDQ
jgi:hypothetical protein